MPMHCIDYFLEMGDFSNALFSVVLNKDEGFVLDLEDYLAGLLMLSSELVRTVLQMSVIVNWWM